MKKWLFVAVWFALLCSSACAQEVLLSSKQGDLSAQVLEVEDGQRILEVYHGDAAERYPQLIPEDMPLEAMSFELDEDSVYARVTLGFAEGLCEKPGYIRFVNEGGVWRYAMIWFVWNGFHYCLEPYQEQWFVSRTGYNHSAAVKPGTLDLSAEGISYDALTDAIVRIQSGAEREDEEKVFSLLEAAFPQERFEAAELVEWASYTYLEKEATLAAVDRGTTTVYLMNDWPDEPQNVCFENLRLGRQEDVHLTMPSPQSEHGSGGGISFDLAEGRFGITLKADDTGYIEVTRCSRERQPDYEWISVKFDAPYFSVYPGYGMNRLEDLMFESAAGMQDPKTFDLMTALAMGETAIADHAAGEEPIIPTCTESEHAFPQPVEGARLKKGKHEVYSGPGKHYYREANGKASVSTNDWVQVFGREGDWALVHYRVNGAHLRFGYVHKSDVQNFSDLPPLHFEETVLCQDNGFVTSDPLGEAAWIELTGKPYEMVRLCRLGKYWMYVEITLPNGKIARMFAEVTPSYG